jgi:leucyl/phenylalanyl-tRNA--protein transferase
MFAKVSDASKTSYAVLVAHLKSWGYAFVDAQVTTDHLCSLGATEVSRDYFLSELIRHRDDVMEHPWEYDATLLENVKK